MSTVIQIEQLRARARRLRALADLIASSPATSIYGLAGPQTWVGPTAQSCFDALLSMSRQLEANRQALCDSARSFDRHADELERNPPLLTMVS